MKITNFELLNITQFLENFADKHLPQRIAYAIVKNSELLKLDANSYNSALQKIIDSYKDFVQKDDDGNEVMSSVGIPEVDADHIEDYMNEINELLGIEIEVNLYHIDESCFDYDDGDKYDALSPKDILLLQNVLCKQEETDEDGDEGVDEEIKE